LHKTRDKKEKKAREREREKRDIESGKKREKREGIGECGRGIINNTKVNCKVKRN
jgi:hypothetical protein